MRKHFKKQQVKFCPICGSNIITHIRDGAFVCGTGDPEKEANGKKDLSNIRCNRMFSVVYPSATLDWGKQHRREIGRFLDEIKF